MDACRVRSSVLVAPLALAQQQKSPSPPMSFFVTSVPIGKDANLGGIKNGSAVLVFSLNDLTGMLQ